MKFIFTIFSLLISGLLFGQEFMRLDSISYEDLDNGINYVSSFSYNDEGQLDTFRNLDGDMIDIAITYNENNDYLEWAVSEAGEDVISFNFIYDIEGHLDSIIGEFADETYELLRIYDITEENNLVSRVTLGEYYVGYQFLFFDRLIAYDDQNRITEIDELDIFYYTGDTIVSWDYSYENGKLFTRTFEDFLDPSNNFKDSMLLTLDGNFEQLTRIFSDDNNIDYDIVYTDNKPFVTGEFVSPFDFYNTLFLLFSEEQTEELIALQNNELPTQHLINGGGDLIRGTWNYSLFTSNSETRIPAKAITVHPNPAFDYIQIDLDSEITKVDVFTIDGQLINSFIDTGKRVDLQNLEAGSYFILVQTEEGGNFISKVVKQ